MVRCMLQRADSMSKYSKVRYMVLSMMLVAIVIAQIGFAQRFDARKLFERCASAVVLIETERGRGAGFFIHPQYIVTNKHVVQRGEVTEQYMLRYAAAYYNPWQISVTVQSGEKLLVADLNPFADHPGIDLAVLKVRFHKGVCLPIKPTAAEVGEEILAIGHSGGSRWNATQGSVSSNSFETFLQLDVALDPGSSGSPLINARGQVVGVVQGGVRLSRTAAFGIRSDILKELLDYYGIPYTLEPMMRPSTAEVDAQLHALQQHTLLQLHQQVNSDRAELERERQKVALEQAALAKARAEFEAKLSRAQAFLAEYETKVALLTARHHELDEREQQLRERQQWLDKREYRLAEKEAMIANKLAEHFAFDLLMSPCYDVGRGSLVPLRGSAGLYYRFGFVRNSYGEVVAADKIGITVTRQLSFWGWEQDEIAFALEFGGQVRVGIGTILHQPDAGRRQIVLPSVPQYTASVMVDFVPHSPWLFGIGVAAYGDYRFQTNTILPSILLGYELTFFRW